MKKRCVICENIQICSTILLDRIEGEPAAEGGRVPAVAVVAEAGVGVEELGGEAVAEEGGHRARGGKNVAESVVVVGGGDGSVLAYVS